MKRSLAQMRAVLCLALPVAVVSCGGGSEVGNGPASKPEIVTSSQPPSGVVGTAYPGFAFTVTGGAGPFMWSESGALPSGLSLSAAGVLSGTPTSSGSFLVEVMVHDGNGQDADPQGFTIQIALATQGPGFAQTGAMSSGRFQHTATLLQNGKVLVAGGVDSNNSPLASAELFNPATGTFAATGSMGTARSGHTATLLSDGSVLIVGGKAGNGNVAAAERFDPATGVFVATGSMGVARFEHTATLLANGKVLVVGGSDNGGQLLPTAELFDPANGIFIPTASMPSGRARHTATLVHAPQSTVDGKVLIAGGIDSSQKAVANAELFDPVNGTFAAADTMHVARAGHAATHLNNGLVLMTGGDGVSSAEVFDVASATFKVTGSMGNERTQHTATLLDDGTVLVAGGSKMVVAAVCGLNCVTEVPLSLATAERFDPNAGAFAPVSDMHTTRLEHTATLLPAGKVLVTGGRKTQVQGRRFVSSANASAELF